MSATEVLESVRLLILATREMREAQKTYFRTRNGSDLSAAKSAERKVDELLARLEKGESTTTQQGELPL